MATIFTLSGFEDETWTRADGSSNKGAKGDVTVPLTLFVEDTDGWLNRDGKTAVLIEAGDDVESVLPFLERLHHVAVDFPAFSDGRGFSAARILREQADYKGDIRATGRYILDQVPLARRCGFSSFEVTKPEVLKALKGGEWPEVTKYLQPVGTVEEIPEGTRPWARRSLREALVAAE